LARQAVGYNLVSAKVMTLSSWVGTVITGLTESRQWNPAWLYNTCGRDVC